MKIWIDLTNSPHINFFKHFINDWKNEGHEVILTCRDLANTIDLIEMNKWRYNSIGGHAGKSSILKLLYFPKRVFQLVKFLRSLKPDLGISHSSFYAPITSRILGIPSIYLNDNEHASGNYLAFLFASKVIIPDCLKSKAIKLKWNYLAKIDFYPGIKESIYLSKDFKSQFIRRIGSKKRIYIRPEPWTAQYYDGRHFFFDELLIECSDDFEIHLLPRGSKQSEHYKSNRFCNILVHEKSLSLEEITLKCDLFIGAGGTMTREIAFMGIPTISIYQSSLLEVDKYLINNNYMLHDPKLTKNRLIKYLEGYDSIKNEELLTQGIFAYTKIKNSIREYGK